MYVLVHCGAKYGRSQWTGPRQSKETDVMGFPAELARGYAAPRDARDQSRIYKLARGFDMAGVGTASDCQVEPGQNEGN